jgi:catechol 1,2-dioxygenase
MNRREFILKSTMFAFAVTTWGIVSANRKTGLFAGDCDTTSDILGPFYRPKAPIRSDMMFRGIKGEPITIKGIAYGSDCITPLKNCMVEVWHASSEGEYDNNSKEYRHRARFVTGEDGKYEFRTIIPGKYLNGEVFRPKHYHFRITAEGYKELVSQIYFQGDPYIDTDPWASAPKAKLRILDTIEENKERAVVFNIYMAESGTKP